MDLSNIPTQKKVSESERAEMQERLNSGVPLFLEIEEIVSEDTVAGVLVLGAFGAPADTKVHVRQLHTHTHIDSLARHIKGSDFMPALRKGDIVCFDRVFIENGDALTARITARTHDRMKGNVQFSMCMARASSTSVNKRGAQQSLTIVDGSQAFVVHNAEEVKLAYNSVKSADWTAGGGGFVVRSPEGRTFEYHVGKDNPLQALVEDLDSRQAFDNGGWLELIPARKFAVGREQVMRDVDVRKEVSKTYGTVGLQFMAPKQTYPGYRKCGIILCDEDEWAFGGKTGKIHRVAAGIQPLVRAVPIEAKSLPTRVRSKPGTFMGVSGLFSPDTMARMAEDRNTRRPEEDRPAPPHEYDRNDRGSNDWRGPDHTENRDKGPSRFSFGR